MKKVKSLKALVLSLMLCLAMGTTAFASEVSTQGQAAPNANKAVEVSDCGDLDVVPAYDDAVALADTIQYDANRTITRSNSRSGVFNGNYYYTINNSSVTKLCLNVYIIIIQHCPSQMFHPVGDHLHILFGRADQIQGLVSLYLLLFITAIRFPVILYSHAKHYKQ